MLLHDAHTESALFTAGSTSGSFTHTPKGEPRAALGIYRSSSAVDTAVVYHDDYRVMRNLSLRGD